MFSFVMLWITSIKSTPIKFAVLFGPQEPTGMVMLWLPIVQEIVRSLIQSSWIWKWYYTWGLLHTLVWLLNNRKDKFQCQLCQITIIVKVFIGVFFIKHTRLTEDLFYFLTSGTCEDSCRPMVLRLTCWKNDASQRLCVLWVLQPSSGITHYNHNILFLRGWCLTKLLFLVPLMCIKDSVHCAVFNRCFGFITVETWELHECKAAVGTQKLKNYFTI